MIARSLACTALVALLTFGCASQAKLLVVQPAIQGPWVGGIQRAEYTVGVAGCEKRTTFVVICPEGGDGCFAAGPGRFIRE
jgi:hypothetical protein